MTNNHHRPKMSPNPILPLLGLSSNDRAVIFHADDIGMFHTGLVAYQELLDFGLLSSAAAMVPTPWFPAACHLYRQNSRNPHLDLGVHLTLTSEWDGFRWGPVLVRDEAGGLIDAEGCFHHRAAGVHVHAADWAVEKECRAQIERALAMGIDITHIDSHMLTLFHPRLASIYIRLAEAYRLPLLLPRAGAAAQLDGFYWAAENPAFRSQLETLEDSGLPLFDHMHIMSLTDADDRLEAAQRALAELPVGLSIFIVHPSDDSHVLRLVTTDWCSRIADYQLFTNEAWRRSVEQSGVKVIGYRILRDLMRGV